MATVFIPQKILDTWTDTGKIELDNNTLTLKKERRTVELNSAVRFRSLLGADEDPHGLLGKIKTSQQLLDLGAEHYMDSVILGDVAYQVEEGFKGDLSQKPPAVLEVQKNAANAPSNVVIAPLSDEALPTLVPQPAPISGLSTPLEKALSESTGGEKEASGSSDESDAEALSRLFLDTVQ